MNLAFRATIVLEQFGAEGETVWLLAAFPSEKQKVERGKERGEKSVEGSVESRRKWVAGEGVAGVLACCVRIPGTSPGP